MNSLLLLLYFYSNAAFKRSNLHQFQKDCHRDHLPFAYLQHDCLNILVGNIYFGTQVKNQ